MDYFSTDPFGPRFVSYLLIFTFLMLVYVTADNLLQAFVGWEGVGLSSFLLINFWKTRGQAVRSAIKALIFNRIGDFGLCLAMGGMYLLFGSLDFATMCLLAPNMAEACLIWMTFKIGALNFIGAWLILAAIGKSAQLGLHGWLADAMEGPTPVSALIHAATMVTAGVFLIYRCSMILEYAPAILCFIASIGAHTALLAASSALVQNDIKKVIAFSTCSQLGYMLSTCGFSMYASSFLHLVNHAFFKALLFLSAGSVIHTMKVAIAKITWVHNSLFFILASASLILGMVLKDVLVGPANPFWGQTLYVIDWHQHPDGEFLNLRMKLFPVVISALGILLAIITGLNGSPMHFPMHLLSNKWYMDFTINHGIVLPWLNVCDRITLQVVDKGLIELVGASVSNAWQEWTTFFQSINSGHLFHSVQVILTFTTCILTVTLLGSIRFDPLFDPLIYSQTELFI